ncbi:MAG: GNAT family N-acetyltransferase [Sneathiella sp.]
MIEIKKIPLDQITQLKQSYMKLTTAPLDGMWLTGFVPMATHYGFFEQTELVGFCCLNADGYLLQFFINSQFRDQTAQVFKNLVGNRYNTVPPLSGAFTSTAEPFVLALCLDNFSNFEVNALMFELPHNGNFSENFQAEVSLKTLEMGGLEPAVDFAHAAIGAPKEWLVGYYGTLIKRQELFGLWQDNVLIATGEARGYDEFQTEYADLGVIVAKAEQNKGLATKILKTLAHQTRKNGLTPICSTEATNIPAQKAISKAGFFSQNRIIEFKA